MKLFLRGLILACVLVLAARADAAIYVIGDDTLGYADNAVSRLQSVGYTVEQGGSLDNYSTFEQVWDMRYGAVKAATWNADKLTLAAYLKDGGRMFMAGERNNLYAGRNAQVLPFVNTTIAAGTLTLTETFNPTPVALQDVTAAGGNVTDFSQIELRGGSSVHLGPGASGFLISESRVNPGSGTFVGWDFGDLPTAPDSRLIVGFDVNIFRPDYGNWSLSDSELITREFAEYLGAVPEPTSMLLFGSAMAGIGLLAYRRGAQVSSRRAT